MRPAQGLSSLDYLSHSPLLKKASYVFGYVIRALMDIGYTYRYVLCVMSLYIYIYMYGWSLKNLLKNKQNKTKQNKNNKKNSNLQACSYDWRIPTNKLEERDGYFTFLKHQIEALHIVNKEKVSLFFPSLPFLLPPPPLQKKSQTP